MICEVQWAKLLEKSALGQLMADTPSWVILVCGLKKASRVETCRVPVEPRSTSASSPPPTPGAIAASICPWKTGVCPKDAFQVLVANCVQDKPTKTTVPLALMDNSGSLPPSGRRSGMLTKDGLVGLAWTMVGIAMVAISAIARINGTVFILSNSLLFDGVRIIIPF